MNKEQFAIILKNCKDSFTYFCENFCKIKHPSGTIMPFKLFKYQKASVAKFKKNKYVIFRKCRQNGISTLTGAYALWLAMFHPNRKVLIVSKRDEDAIAYLDRNIKFVYENLPSFFHEMFGDPSEAQSRKYAPCKMYNEHTIEFWHGSEIKSLTSSKNTLRSNSASLVIIDEAAFIPDMDEMWLAGQPTLTHGGNVIVISTSNGRGNWYCNTWEDAIEGKNDFIPIEIPWYEMDWVLEWYDDIRGVKVRLAPSEGIRLTANEQEKAKFGKYWSPWLADQYRQLQEKGEAWKFRQEILMEFIGAGNTVLSYESLLNLAESVDNNYKIVDKTINYVSADGSMSAVLNFENHLWVWKMPIRDKPPIKSNGKIIKPGILGHKYALGADISSGEATDFSSIVIIDATEMEEVLELCIKVETHVLEKMIDYLGRIYNNALAVVESTGIGKPIVQDLRSVYFYPNLFYRRNAQGKREKVPGFPTSGASKAHIVKALIDNMGISKEDGGVLFKSTRMNKQANSFIHLGGGRVGNEKGAGNNDDLIIGGGLALLGIMDALTTVDGMVPVSSQNLSESAKGEAEFENLVKKGGFNLVYPMLSTSEASKDMTIEQELQKFATQIGGINPASAERVKMLLPATRDRKHQY